MGFVKNFSFTLGVRILVLAISAISSIIVVRMLGAEAQGTLTLMVTTSAVLITFFGGGLQWSNIYWVGRNKEDSNVIFFNSLVFAIAICFLLSAIYLIGGYRILNRFLPYTISVIVFIALPFLLNQHYNQAILQGFQDFFKYNIVEIFRVTSLLITYIILIVILKLRTLAAAGGWLFTVIFTSIISFYLVNKRTRLGKIRLDVRQLWKSIKVGFRACLSTSIWCLLARIDMYLIGYFLGSTSVGYYSIAVLIAELLFLAPQVAGQLIFPKAAAQERDSHLLAARVNRISIVYSLALALIIAAAGKYIFMFLFGQDFIKSFYPMIFLLPGIIAINSGSTVGYYLGGKEGYPPILIISMFLALVANIFLNLILIPRFSITGAALSSSVAYMIYITLYCIYFKKLTKLSFRDFLIPKWKDLAYLRGQVSLYK
jgi:O-antigen/teichoic acid export membrane protein